MNEIQEFMKSLTDSILQYNFEYYTMDHPSVSDDVYNQRYQELVAYEGKYPQWKLPYSPTHRVGGEIKSELTPVKHRVPMLSIRTETDISDQGAINFYNQVTAEIGTVEYIGEVKYDGLAITLRYENDILVQAATRGDGFVGEDVTHNAKTIKNIPLKIDSGFEVFEVRGEVMMLKQTLKEVNQRRIENGEKPLINTRNAAAGSIRQLDSKIAASRDLRFYAYGVGEVVTRNDKLLHSQSAVLSCLTMLGFQSCPENRICRNVDELIQFHRDIEKEKADLDYDIDGVVYKVNLFDHQNALGFRTREPRWAVAHKFAPEEAVSVLEAIDVQVGRTGAITPVARITPVFVGGVTVTNVTLHNESEIHRKGLNIGDQIVVRRAGDVVPEIVGPLNPTDSGSTYQIPRTCPCCSTPLTKSEEDAVWRCPAGLKCKEQVIQSTLHLGSRKGFHIDGLGEASVRTLYDNGLIKSPLDIFSLSKDLKKVQALLGDKIGQNLIDAIDEKKTVELGKFLFALGIRNVGESTANDIANHFKTLSKIRTASLEEYLTIPDVGPTVANSIFQYMEQYNPELPWVTLEFPNEINVVDVAEKSSELEGITFVITGTVGGIDRDTLKDRIQSHGGKVSGSVSKKTSYLLVGDNPGASKIADAVKHNVVQLEYRGVLKLFPYLVGSQ